MNPDDLNQVEHEQISTSLEVERLEVNLFRSKSLWVPLNARGVFGGQVISQAVVSATHSVPPVYSLHSLHCYFLAKASPATPIVYQVDHVRNGNSYVTRAVRAVQNGHNIFIMVCSFHKPEPWQPSLQWRMPEVPPPDQCEDEVDLFTRLIKDPKTPQRNLKLLEDILDQRKRSPIDVRLAKDHDISEGGVVRYMYWMKARNIPKYEAPFQKGILAYISDLRFIATPSRILGLKGRTGPNSLGMSSTIDHVIWFYDHDFDTGDWLLYEMESPRIGSGRAVVHGRIYTRDGRLIAVVSQEGVLRTNIRAPEELKQETKPMAKL
ncbi:thioesterase-like superfamily-domain-containing protein [Crepidotus variabilis]|uniref:Thioesterase-like superfamily-domain-containing protein n=1 Tax=Crepidotus variabilis TaxID=179855 RepID=A0A9P6JX55_9AGAR|nr:thioesterase-like superfamily-domain-containing protein [Crepidotus variabilis]